MFSFESWRFHFLQLRGRRSKKTYWINETFLPTLFVNLGLNLDLNLELVALKQHWSGSGKNIPGSEFFFKYNCMYFFSDLHPKTTYSTELLESRSAILQKRQNSREALPSLQQIGTRYLKGALDLLLHCALRLAGLMGPGHCLRPGPGNCLRVSCWAAALSWRNTAASCRTVTRIIAAMVTPTVAAGRWKAASGPPLAVWTAATAAASNFTAVSCHCHLHLRIWIFPIVRLKRSYKAVFRICIRIPDPYVFGRVADPDQH